MNKQDSASAILPADALPFVRELLLEIKRRIPSALGPPPQLAANDLADPTGCVDAARALVRWFDTLPTALGERMGDLETEFVSMLEIVQQLDTEIHRAVLRSRSWVEEEMAFAHTVREVLERLEDAIQLGPWDDKTSTMLRQLIHRMEAKGRANRDEAAAISTRFATVQQDIDRLRDQIARIQEDTRELHSQGLRDGLTGLWNRRAYDDRIAEEASRAARYGCPVSIALWDVDRFRALNDRHGHRVGDLALQALAARIARMLRRSDFLARYGGEEFVVILANTDLAQALMAGRKICTAISGEVVETPAGPLEITVSVGVASFVPGDTPESLFARADQALCRAKQAGRNRVEASLAKQRRPARSA